MTATVQHSLPMILAEVEVTSAELLSPSYVRVELGSPELAELPRGPLYDQRIKLVFPKDDGHLASFRGADESWFTTWLGLPVEERGHMRTYTIREVRGSGSDTRIVVDFVLHPGDHGPGSSWAASASAGDRAILLAPRRGMPFGGIEFAPGVDARQLLLVGDETAAPAICSILDDLPADARGAAFLEVPVADDIQDVEAPAGVEVHWLPRDGEPLGTRVTPAVLAHLDVPVAEVELPDDAPADLWETPTYSGSGEEIPDERLVGHDLDGLYAWIAGESSIVTALRRHLVKELGVDRRQVAFMGYWRRGVAMRS